MLVNMDDSSGHDRQRQHDAALRPRIVPSASDHPATELSRYAVDEGSSRHTSVEHRRHKGLNNRAENSHQPTRERERRMRRFKSPGHAQRFLAAYGPIASHFRPRRHRLTAAAYRDTRADRFATWREVTGVAAAA